MAKDKTVDEMILEINEIGMRPRDRMTIQELTEERDLLLKENNRLQINWNKWNVERAEERVEKMITALNEISKESHTVSCRYVVYDQECNCSIKIAQKALNLDKSGVKS